MIIDGHAHASGEFADPERMISSLDRLGVDKVVLVPGLIESTRSETVPVVGRLFPHADLMLGVNRLIRVISGLSTGSPSPASRNHGVLSLANAYPGRVVPFYWADPACDGFMDEIVKQHAIWKFRGVKLHQPSRGFSVVSEEMHNLAEFASSHRLPVFIHLFGARDALELVDLAKAHRRTDFVLAHLIGMEAVASRGAEAPNICFDTSPFPLISDFRLAECVKTFGADRVILGSDTPYGRNNLERSLYQVDKLALSSSEKAAIAGGNMARLIGLG